MGKKLLRADHECVIGYIHSSYLITGREIIKILKKTGRRKLQELHCTNIAKPRAPENQTLATQ
jgi:hypothetical protein